MVKNQFLQSSAGLTDYWIIFLTKKVQELQLQYLKPVSEKGGFIFLYVTVQNFKKRTTSYLPVLCSPWLILTRSPQISGQNKSEDREPEGLVKITYGIVASSLFKRAGNSN